MLLILAGPSFFLGNKLVTQLIPLAADDGILRQMYDEGISHDKAVSIIVDFMLAAADTVS